MFNTAIMIVTIFACGAVLAAGEEISVKDILDANYLPGTLLLLDAEHRTVNGTGNTSQKAGDLGGAFVTMNYHRRMMNEYLCRSYVAEQILSGVEEPRMLQDRQGAPATNTTRPRHKKFRTSAVKQSLLADPGSSHYKNWLDRTTTLEDIYRHYEDLTSDEDDSHDEIHSTAPEYDGEVTGFAVHHHPGYLTGHATSGPGKVGSGYGGGGGSSGYGSTSFSSSGSGYGATSPGYSYHPSDKGDKGMSLKDLFELALTALAFLSFGLFVLNIIMCIAGGDSTTTPNPDVESSTGTRVRRSFPTLGVSSTETLNIMAGRVLRSIEAFHAAHYGGASGSEDCLRRALCDNNRFSRSLQGSDRIWLPVWSLGLSWVAGRFSPTMHTSAAMLEYLRASLLGLGNSRCEVLFNNCPDNLLASSRNARRERRQRSKRRGDSGPMESPPAGKL